MAAKRKQSSESEADNAKPVDHSKEIAVLQEQRRNGLISDEELVRLNQLILEHRAAVLGLEV